VSLISLGDQVCVRGSSDVDVAAVKGSRNLGRDVLIQMEADGHRSGCFFQVPLAQFRFE
jgi:hypothetical protein